MLCASLDHPLETRGKLSQPSLASTGPRDALLGVAATLAHTRWQEREHTSVEVYHPVVSKQSSLASTGPRDSLFGGTATLAYAQWQEPDDHSGKVRDAGRSGRPNPER